MGDVLAIFEIAMSLNRENVVWPSRNGTWSRGFFDHYHTGDDPEWDVEYDYDTFTWCSTGHPTMEAACAAWRGPNPGGITSYETPNVETDRLDAMAEKYLSARSQAKQR
ncbi:hypothetical protein ACFQVB_37650 [Paraburkholderia humisilvae]